MENCLFIANLPQSLNNYELTIALYLVFSRYGKVTVVKASRDTAHRPFGFVEFSNIKSCMDALEDNEKDGGIVIGGRRVRLEMARNTLKIYIKLPSGQDFNSIQDIITRELPVKSTPIPIPNENAFMIKLNGNSSANGFLDKLVAEHPDWMIQYRNDQELNYRGSFAEGAQRQSGLFQLRIPESGVLPVSPTTLAKVHSFSPCLQYSLTPLADITPISQSLLINRLYEDWYDDGHEESFTEPFEARTAASRLDPPLGEWDGDVFIGRLDNQKVTLKSQHDFSSTYGKVTFMRLCNRSVIREDRVPVDSTAFLRFNDAEVAKKFIECENGATWMGRIIKCEKCWSVMGRNTPPISLGETKL